MAESTAAVGILAAGVHVPRRRIARAVIACAHAWMSAAPERVKGSRTFTSWDEDAVTMGVEAARPVLRDANVATLRALYLASTTAPFADLQNASLVASALGLPSAMRTLDAMGSQRCATSALATALASGEHALVIGSDAPRTRPASAQEMQAGAGAAAIRVGTGRVIAECLSQANESRVFVDHFRAATERYDYAWEERWIREEGYFGLVPGAAAAALRAADISADAVTHFVFAAPAGASLTTAVAKRMGLRAESCAASHAETIGHAGAAAPLLALVDVLERAAPGDIVLLVSFGQGVDAIVLRVTEEIEARRASIGFRRAVDDRIEDDAYLRMLSFQDAIELDWGMRAEKDVRTALTEQYRSQTQVASFAAGRCGRCGTVQFPQLEYCVNRDCLAPSTGFRAEPLADVGAHVVTHTADWLSFHPAPPLYVGFVQFDNGARVLMEFADVGPERLEVGTAVRMVYRIKDLDRLRGYRRYFWKAAPIARVT
jgi:3-hydroxy-3-methylglutaryl CoA synthase